MLLLLLLAVAAAQNCNLIVPNAPLTAVGLAKPYILTGCDIAVAPAFVQAGILNRDTGEITRYDPLVINMNTVPAIPPAPVTLPPNRVVALWFGSNGDTLTLVNNKGMRGANCVNGLPNSVFGQFAYCNAPAFFAAAKPVGALGVASDGLPCPTTRSFMVADADPSDNLQTTYLLTAAGQTAQDTPANRQTLGNFNVLRNPSDEALLDLINAALKCQAPQITSLVDNIQHTSFPTNELIATLQAAPQALIPPTDPMVLMNAKPNVRKLNLYRAGVNQPPVNAVGRFNLTSIEFCTGLVVAGAPRLQNNKGALAAAPSPAAAANSLFTFLAFRFNTTFTLLQCANFIKNPVKLAINAGVVVDANFVAV
jgi:hypothetical protein